MTIELFEPVSYPTVTRLIAASPQPRRRWSLTDRGDTVVEGRGEPRKWLLGKEIPWRLLTEDSASGYSVQAGAAGVTVLEDGRVQLLSDSAGTSRVALRLPCWGTQHLFTRLALGLTVSAVAPSVGSWPYQSTRVGIVHITEGTGEAAYAEALFAYNGSAWPPSIHITDGTNHDVATGTTIPVSNLAQLTFILRPSSLGSPNYPHFQADAGEVWGSPRVRSAGKLGQYSGLDWSTDPNQGGFFEIYVERGGGTSVMATLSSIVVEMYGGTEPVA